MIIVNSRGRKSGQQPQQLTLNDRVINLADSDANNLPDCDSKRRSRRSTDLQCQTKYASCPDCEKLSEAIKNKACNGFEIG